MLVKEQYSFKKGISNEDADFRLKDGEFKSINQKMCVGGISYELVKVFDYVNHDILVAKLHLYGILGVSEDWFRSYLTNRRQKVAAKSPNIVNIFF